ncbi:unnamed protein product, partial [Didymodactylos carnosus]
LSSLGLEDLSTDRTDAFASKLLTPTTFLVVNILQLYYFHSGWMDMIKIKSDKNIQGLPTATLQEIHKYARENVRNTDYRRTESILKTKPTNWHESLYKLYFYLNRYYKRLTYYAWRFAEIHIYKFVLFIMILVATLNVSAFNIVLVILATIGLVLFRIRALINLLTMIATGLYIIIAMIYQLAILYVFLTLVLTFDGISRYRQRHRRMELSEKFNVHLVENKYSILFEPFCIKNTENSTYEYDIVNYKQADEGIVLFLQYLINFFFYRFGLEICYITTVIVIAVRLDVVAIFYAIWLGLFLMSRRRALVKIWPIYLLFLLIVFPAQYLFVVGAPPFLCLRYWWSHVSFNGWPELKRWLYLPDYEHPPSARLLIADFFQLFFACQQWRVFDYENNEKDNAIIDAGGSNSEIIYNKDLYMNNPTWDYVVKKRHWLDQFKYIGFMYGCWIVLAIAYFAGTTRISLLGLGYLIACVYFLWYGQEFFTKPILRLLKMWNYLIYYCFGVIFIKACLQVIVCTFLYKAIACGSAFFCAFMDLFVSCLKREYIPQKENCSSIMGEEKRSTLIGRVVTVLVTQVYSCSDGFCLIFLLLQKRIFSSYYWEHIVVEFRSQAKFASQGAVLLNKINQNRLDEDGKREDETVSKIKRSIDRIKAQQKKLNQTDGQMDELTDHFEAIRSGDYYMFDYDGDDISDVESKDEATVAQEQILEVLTSNDTKDSDLQKIPVEEDLQRRQQITTTTSVQEQQEVPKESSSSVIKSIFGKIASIVIIIIDYIIKSFNHHSRDYRQVSSQLVEMKLKDKVVQQTNIEQDEQQPPITTVQQGLIIDLDPLPDDDNNTTIRTNIQEKVSTASDNDVLANRSRFYRLSDSIFYMVMSRSELLCYTAMVINHLTSGALLSMPLPLSIFLWAMLSKRPSRNYWITILTYTEVMIVIKYIFQFRFYPWNKPGAEEHGPLFLVNIIGIDRKGGAASVADLFLLLSLFLHRSILKVH